VEDMGDLAAQPISAATASDMSSVVISRPQGMSDLAAPLLYVMQDEAEAFWAFAALMDRCEANFHTDCTCASISDGRLEAVIQDQCR